VTAHSLLPPTSVSPGPGFEAGGIDQLNNYPITMNLRTHELIHHSKCWGKIPKFHQSGKLTRSSDVIVNDESCGKFRSFKDVWFPIALAGPAVFHQVLSNSSLHLSQLRGSRGANFESMAHHAAAIRSVNLRIAHPTLGVSDGIIGAVTAFLCHDVSSLSKLEFSIY
jgi:hypothetical protein